MRKITKKWEVVGSSEDIIETLLKNRGVDNSEQFFNPKRPIDLEPGELGIKEKELRKVIKRLKEAKENQEKVIIYGDYDADGICATAVLWEMLYRYGLNILPYLPERFSEGYGINVNSVKKLKAENKNLKLIITVDNGITANKEIQSINKLGIEIIVLDHHQAGKILPKAYAIIHTTKICAAAIAWVVGNQYTELSAQYIESLDLVAIATIADQVPLLGPNRSFAKYGLEVLRKTARPGLLALYKEAGIDPNSIGVYVVGFLIAPRINAMGRLEHAIDSLRLLCTTKKDRAIELAHHLGKINNERQKIVEEVVTHARQTVGKEIRQKIIILSHASYHEGVIGLAAAKLVEQFYRPAIVISKGKTISKASARSIAGFNIIEVIRQFDDLLESGGGHPMAAGFSIKTAKVDEFVQKFIKAGNKLLNEENLYPILKIDMEIDFRQITNSLVKNLKQFEPSGLGNPTPVFLTKGVEILEVKTVGADKKHLKLALKNKKIVFEAIAFGMGEYLANLALGQIVDVVYNLDENVWNGNRSVQLKIKDINILNSL